MPSTSSSLRYIPVVALALAAGTALPVFADSASQPKLAVSAGKASSALSLNGTAFHSTRSSVFRPSPR